MKTVLLLIATLTSSTLIYAQLPGTFIGNKKIPPHNIITKELQSPEIMITNQQVMGIGSANSSSIVIDYTNNLVPVEANDDNFFTFDQPIPAPAAGENKVYDFGNLVYESENFFTNSLVRPPAPNMPGDRTAYRIPENIIDFNGFLVDTLFEIYATNDRGLYKTSVHFTSARASLESITGVVTDSLIISEQTVVLPRASLVQAYPTTYGTQWIQNPGKSGPTIFISLASEGLDHAPVQIIHEHNFVHKIVGWGRIKIPTANGSSNYLECLLDKESGPDITTLFVNGRPASKAVSTIFFGNQKYKQTINISQYQFLKKGFWDLGAEAVLVTDPGFSKVLYAIFDESYLDIDCANGDGVKMCLEGHIDCVPYANNEANTAMLISGATLGSCDGRIPIVTQPGNKLQNAMHAENNAILAGTKLELYPNPTATFARVSFSLPQSQKVSIQIFDMTGRLVKSLVDAQMEAGAHQLIWNDVDEKGSPVRTGVYFWRFSFGKYSETKMLSVVR